MAYVNLSCVTIFDFFQNNSSAANKPAFLGPRIYRSLADANSQPAFYQRFTLFDRVQRFCQCHVTCAHKSGECAISSRL